MLSTLQYNEMLLLNSIRQLDNKATRTRASKMNTLIQHNYPKISSGQYKKHKAYVCEAQMELTSILR